MMRFEYFFGILLFVLVGGFLTFQYATLSEKQKLDDTTRQLQEMQMENAAMQAMKDAQQARENAITQEINKIEIEPETKTETKTQEIITVPDLIIDLVGTEAIIFSKSAGMNYSIKTLNGPILYGMAAPVTATLTSGLGKTYSIYSDTVHFQSEKIPKGSGLQTSFIPEHENMPPPGLYTLTMSINEPIGIGEINFANNKTSLIVMVAPGVNGDSLAALWRFLSAGTSLSQTTWGISGDDDYYDGGPDFDTLAYSGAYDEYIIVRSPASEWSVSDIILIQKKSDNSLDIAVNIEQFVFKDQAVLASTLF